MPAKLYNQINQYIVYAELTEPMHIGGAKGNKENVLVHPVDMIPFIQASSLNGAFRAAFKQSFPKSTTDLFGSPKDGNHDDIIESRIKFSDGNFIKDSIHMELRPHLKINAETGSVMSDSVKGSDRTSGFKFETEYIGAGAILFFTIYDYGTSQILEDDKKNLMEVLSELHGESLQIGGEKSDGCGYMKLLHVYYHNYDMTSINGRNNWKNESIAIGNEEDYQFSDILTELPETKYGSIKYSVIVNGRTDGNLLVKSITVDDRATDEHLDAVNIKNSKGEYIIPGSSLKGSIRNRMEMIARYLYKDGSQNVIDNCFGTSNEQPDLSHAGNLKFRDTVVGNSLDEQNLNNLARVEHRIHINKFTGGVINGALFSTKPVSGNLSFQIDIVDTQNPEVSLGLLLLALRDLQNEEYGFGSGYSIGKGFIHVQEISIKDHSTETESKITYGKSGNDGKIEDSTDIIKMALAALNRKA